MFYPCGVMDWLGEHTFTSNFTQNNFTQSLAVRNVHPNKSQDLTKILYKI